MKPIFVFAISLVFLSFVVEDKLTGRWETKLKDGNALGVIFKPDQSLAWYLNKKPFVSGTYMLYSDTFMIKGMAALK